METVSARRLVIVLPLIILALVMEGPRPYVICSESNRAVNYQFPDLVNRFASWGRRVIIY